MKHIINFLIGILITIFTIFTILIIITGFIIIILVIIPILLLTEFINNKILSYKKIKKYQEDFKNKLNNQ